MRYAYYRSDKPLRILGSPEESRLKNRSIIDPGYDDGYYDDGYYEDGYYEDGNYDYRDGRGYPARTGRRDVRGTTVREYRKRQSAARRHLSTRAGRRLIAAIMLLVLLAIGFGVYQSSLFKIREVSIEGTQYLSEERIRELAVIPEGSTLLRIRFNDILASIEAEPWVEKVEIHRSFPSTVVITITERKVVAIVEVLPQSLGENTQNWLISADGFWLGFYEQEDLYAAEAEIEADEKAAAEGDNEEEEGAENSGAGAGGTGNVEGNEGNNGNEESENGNPESESIHRGKVRVFDGIYLAPSELKSLPLVKEIAKTVEPKLGRKITDEGLLNALAIVNGFSPEMLQIVLSISAPDKIKTNLVLTNHVNVAFGAAEDIKAKEAVILEFLAKYEGRIVYINVRVPDRPNIRLA